MVKITIRDSLFFSFDGKKSADYGIFNVNLNSGMQEESLAATRELREQTVRGRDKPYFEDIAKQPLKFDVSFAFEDRFNTVKLREVTRWLTEHSYYRPLYFTNEIGKEPEKIYYAVVVDSPTLIHNSLQQGYVKLSFRCDSPYAYSPPIKSKDYDWIDSPYTRSINNFSPNQQERTVIDPSGKIILNPFRPRWMDDPPGTTWLD
ncbi:phage tail domain-containing protein [Cellulosimicrobium cellulans]|uniref:phage tail domain-containing protein n=1 Tax=Cellulosimicrobium cellulans TaxID=1710 RepID=UPI0036ED3777